MNEPQGLNELRHFDRVEEYGGDEADFRVYMESDDFMQELRVHWLGELRDKWKWIDDVRDPRDDLGYAIMKRRSE